MSESLRFVLSDRTYLEAALAVKSAPFGWVVQICEPDRTPEQNDHAHAALTDIARQVKWHGQKLSVLVWKRLTMAAYLREIGQQPQLIPALDGNGFDVIFEHSSKLGKKKFSGWVDWIYLFGHENGVTFRTNRHAA